MTISQPLRTDARSPEPPPPGESGARRGRRTLVLAIVAAAVAAVLLAVLVVPTLFDKQPRRSGTNSAFPTGVIAKIGPNQTLCQAAIVPQDTRAIEIPFQNGARGTGVSLELKGGATERVIARSPAGQVRARATRFTLPSTLRHDVLGQVCLHQDPGHTALVLGASDKRGLELDGKIAPGAISMAYYRPGSERLISMLPVIAQRIGRTRGHLGGAWRGVAVLLLFAVGVGLSVWLLVGLARRRARRVALVVAVVAGVNALAWGFLTPTFQTPDEPYHVSYVQDLAEHGKPPRAAKNTLSGELQLLNGAAAVGDLNFNPFGRGYWSADADRRLAKALATKPSTDNGGANANVRDYPPGYYAALVPAYGVTHAAGGSTLDALTFMRGIGALLAMVTVLALFAMLRELFPDRPLLTAGAALLCAFQPVFTWISGGVNPDAGLIPVGAVLFWLLARAHRRGLTTPLAAAIGLTVAVAGLVKLSGFGLAPGAALGVALLLWRGRDAPSGWLRPGLAALAGVFVPIAIYAFLVTVVWHYPLLPGTVGEVASSPSPTGVKGTSGFASYLWEYVLPRVGSMTDFFHVRWTPKDFWTPLFVGRFGWFDYGFSSTINNVAFVVYAVIAIAALAALIPRLRRDWLLVVVYLALAAGLAVAIARVGYPLRASGNFLFEQARYVLPLLGLYALALALAFSWLRGRALVAITSITVGLASLHLLAAFVLTIRRYYL